MRTNDFELGADGHFVILAGAPHHPPALADDDDGGLMPPPALPDVGPAAGPGPAVPHPLVAIAPVLMLPDLPKSETVQCKFEGFEDVKVHSDNHSHEWKPTYLGKLPLSP